MKSYWLKVVAVAAAFCLLHLSILLCVRGPIAAEYWVRELILIKRYCAAQIPRPKLIFLGGSSVLFGVDAKTVEKSLGMPAINDGLHAGMRLEDILQEGSLAAKPGDTVVLLLEASYYEPVDPWSEWQLTNALAWNRPSIDGLPFFRRLAVFSRASSLGLSTELLVSSIGEKLCPRHYEQRQKALAPAPTIIARFLSGKFHNDALVYHAYNIDEHGDLGRMEGAFFWGNGLPVTQPGRIAPSAKAMLTRFVSDMKARKVRVLVGYPPYLVDGEDQPDWKPVDALFRRDIADTGSRVIQKRSDLFLPRKYFYNDHLHLNEEGRAIRTALLLSALRGELP